MWAVDNETTGIWTVYKTDIRIFRDGNMIVVDGVNAGNEISVYNIAGLLINAERVTDGCEKVYITVPTGQYYIVTVDGVAAKINMTK